ncbi:MAG: CHAD domain-containing protein, partial [Nocardiopsaceae bacterium]|nr:CHAD domain-containing protein [Nocardiopsaceae bacterium]
MATHTAETRTPETRATETPVQEAARAYPASNPGGGRHLNARSTAGEVAAAYLGTQAARLRDLEEAVRRDEPDAVHQMRVSTRRLRAALQSFPTIWPRPVTARLRAELRWLGRALGAARDTEVLSARLHDGLDDLPAELVLGPAKARLTVHFAPRAAAGRETVIEALDSPRYLELLGELG